MISYSKHPLAHLLPPGKRNSIEDERAFARELLVVGNEELPNKDKMEQTLVVAIRKLQQLADKRRHA